MKRLGNAKKEEETQEMITIKKNLGTIGIKGNGTNFEGSDGLLLKTTHAYLPI